MDSSRFTQDDAVYAATVASWGHTIGLSSRYMRRLIAALPAPLPDAAPMPSLAPMVKRVSPAVVNIATRGTIKEQPGQRNPLLDGLEEHGFVCKGTCESDARVTYAVVTEAGLKKLKEASCSHVGAIQGLFEERFNEAELGKLADLLSRLPGAGSADAGECTAP